ncbi:MAG: hypothetical protein ACKO96_00580 [Flammeovirgaceae bacterium]
MEENHANLFFAYLQTTYRQMEAITTKTDNRKIKRMVSASFGGGVAVDIKT